MRGAESGEYGGPVQAGEDPVFDAEMMAMRARIDLTGMPRLSRAVTERIILASADPSYATDLACSEPYLEAAVSALALGAPVVADSPMVAAGLSGSPLICKAETPLTLRLARTAGIGAAAAAVRLALAEAGAGAVWVAGSEPDAIYEIAARGAAPALVIGMPAGFVAAAAAKRALRESGLPALTNVSGKGGPAVAAAACLALIEAAGTGVPGETPVLNRR
jgi:precorrin-8X/cobalt-precorrin-8 methylmutase